MQEKIVELGHGFRLSSILTLPDSIDVNKAALIILNSGVMHRIGTCRTSVSLARKVAADGRVALRFDLSGIGDSLPRSTGESDDERINNEISAALEYLKNELGIKRFYLYGLCSGAQNSFKAALKDERIIGLAGIDGYAYPTKKFYKIFYGRRILQLSSWIKLLKRIFETIKSRITPKQEIGENDFEMGNIWPPYPPREEAEKGYQALISRGVNIFMVYTGSWSGEYNYEDQFYDMYPSVDFKKQLELRLIPEASHIMAEPQYQDEILNSIANWLNKVD